MIAGGASPPGETADAFARLISGTGAEPAASMGGPMLERRSIAEQVANRIMGMIKSGNLKSGERLPTEQQMGIALGISRPPLREALKALTLMGVLESRQGGRYTVTDLSPSRLVAPFNIMLSVHDYDVDRHFEARAVVDLALVAMCAERASAEQRQRILELARDGRDLFFDSVAFRINDAEFHQSIYLGSANNLLTTLAQGLYDVAIDERRKASAMPGVIEKSVSQHIAVAEAIVQGDAGAAVSAYRAHLEHVRCTTVQSMQGP